MADDKGEWDRSFIASGDLTGKQFFAVKLISTKDTVALATTAPGAIGILQNKPSAGQGAEVRLLGDSKAQLDGSAVAISVGSLLTATTLGVLVVGTSPNIIAYANVAATTSGVIGGVILMGGAPR